MIRTPETLAAGCLQAEERSLARRHSDSRCDDAMGGEKKIVCRCMGICCAGCGHFVWQRNKEAAAPAGEVLRSGRHVPRGFARKDGQNGLLFALMHPWRREVHGARDILLVWFPHTTGAVRCIGLWALWQTGRASLPVARASVEVHHRQNQNPTGIGAVDDRVGEAVG